MSAKQAFFALVVVTAVPGGDDSAADSGDGARAKMLNTPIRHRPKVNSVCIRTTYRPNKLCRISAPRSCGSLRPDCVEPEEEVLPSLRLLSGSSRSVLNPCRIVSKAPLRW